MNESLSDKIQDEYGDRCCKVEDVREAVRRLKDFGEWWHKPKKAYTKQEFIDAIDKIFGNDLI